MENIIFGIRPVAEAIEAGKQIEKLYIRKGAEGALMTELRDLCFRHRIRVQEVPVEKLNRLVRGNHQGVVAQIAEYDARFAAGGAYNEADFKAYNDLKARYDHQMHEWEKASYELEITEGE